MVSVGVQWLQPYAPSLTKDFKFASTSSDFSHPDEKKKLIMLNSSEIPHHIHEYGEIILSCTVFITKGIHDKSNDSVLHYTCALLNSGGGILTMCNADRNMGVMSKHLDTWWSGMESNIAVILSGDDICNYVDFIGNFDDEYFYLFIKSAEHLCTIDYGCRLPTDTATHCVTYKSAVKLCSQTGGNKALSTLPVIPYNLVYGRTEETLKQEGKQIQFKLLTSRKDSTKGGKSLATKVGFYSSKYITAFANHDGGHIYFGIEDETAAVIGEEMTSSDQAKIVDVVQSKMDSVIWGDPRFAALKGIHWDVRFIPVQSCPYQTQRMVIVVSVCKMYGGVFTSCPESYIVCKLPADKNASLSVKHQQGPKYSVRRLDFDEWKKELLSQTRDIESLHSRFVKVPLQTPQARLVFSLPHTLSAAGEKVLSLECGFNLQPKNILDSFPDVTVKRAITRLVSTFSVEPHLVISLESWGLDLELPLKPPNVVAVLAVFSSLYGLHVVTLVSGNPTTEDLWYFSYQTALRLKQTLVQHGGCHTHLGFKVHVLDVNAPRLLEYFQGGIDVDIYPVMYKMREQNLQEIVKSLLIAIASYRPFSTADQYSATDHYFLLTCDQLKLLWQHQLTRQLWVHGPPGAGKTVAAMEMIRELRRRGCQSDEVLYMAENSLLCSYVSSFQMCLVVSRRQFMEDSRQMSLFQHKYGHIKNVLVDEAQNFKDRDGDWYSQAEKLSQQNLNNPTDWTTGFFWVFMDYAQKVHKFKAGLPGLIGKNNFMLSEISRNSKEIFEYASKFMMKESEAVKNESYLTDNPKLGHEFASGQDVSIVKCDKGSIHDRLFQVLKRCTEDGVNIEDIAILVSKKTDAVPIRQALEKDDTQGHKMSPALPMEVSIASDISPDVKQDVKEENVSSDGDCQAAHEDMKMFCDVPMQDSGSDSKVPVLVSTVREFSGLDRPVIIGIDPHTNQEHADLDKVILNLATRAKDSLVILTTSQQLLDKLQPQTEVR